MPLVAVALGKLRDARYSQNSTVASPSTSQPFSWTLRRLLFEVFIVYAVGVFIGNFTTLVIDRLQKRISKLPGVCLPFVVQKSITGVVRIQIAVGDVFRKTTMGFAW